MVFLSPADRDRGAVWDKPGSRHPGAYSPGDIRDHLPGLVLRDETRGPGHPDRPPVSYVSAPSQMAGIPPCHHCQSRGRYLPAYPGVWWLGNQDRVEGVGLQCLGEQGSAGHAGRREVVPARVAPAGETGVCDPVRDGVKVPGKDTYPARQERGTFSGLPVFFGRFTPPILITRHETASCWWRNHLKSRRNK